MKRLFFAVVLMTMGYGALAQIDFGPRVNLTSTNLSLSENLTNIQEGDAEFGYQLGAFLRVQIPVIGIYIQPEALLSKQSSSININSQKADLTFNQIDVPVMIGFKLGSLRVNAGPSFRFISSADLEVPGDPIEDVKEYYKNSTVGYQAGVGIDIWKLVFDLKYEGSLTEINEDLSTVSPIEIDQRVSQIVFGVGFKLF